MTDQSDQTDQPVRPILTLTPTLGKTVGAQTLDDVAAQAQAVVSTFLDTSTPWRGRTGCVDCDDWQVLLDPDQVLVQRDHIVSVWTDRPICQMYPH